MPNNRNSSLVREEAFPSNSHVSKQETEEKEPRQIQKVTKGRVIKQKKSLGKKFSESFLGDDSKSVGAYILYDVLIPAARDTIVDMVKGGIEMLVYGEKRSSNVRRDGGRSFVSYGSYYKQSDRDRDRGDSRRDISRIGRTRHDFDEILLETRGEAEEVLSNMVEICEKYQFVSVADLYDLVGIESHYTDNKYGWTDLRNSSVSRTRGGYLLDLPKTQPLD